MPACRVVWADTEEKGDLPMKRLLAWLLALCLAAPAALAETIDYAQVWPLVNATATAVMLAGENISPENTMSAALVQRLLQAGVQQGLIDESAQDAAWQESYLAAAYAAPFAAIGDTAEAEDYAYYGVRLMAMDESDDDSAVRLLGDVYQADDCLENLTDEQYARVQWLDRRAVVELRRSAAAPGGWQVYSFSLDAEWEMEQAAQDYFASAMAEYVNAEWGFSMQYPAVFTEEHVTVGENGISGELPEASFSVTRLVNDQGWTIESLLEARKQETPGAETNINDMTGCGRLTVSAGGQVQVVILAVTQGYIYQAEVRYQQSQAKDFALYCDYMMNSFTVDELGLG